MCFGCFKKILLCQEVLSKPWQGDNLIDAAVHWIWSKTWYLMGHKFCPIFTKVGTDDLNANLPKKIFRPSLKRVNCQTNTWKLKRHHSQSKSESEVVSQQCLIISEPNLVHALRTLCVKSTKYLASFDL